MLIPYQLMVLPGNPVSAGPRGWSEPARSRWQIPKQAVKVSPPDWRSVLTEVFFCFCFCFFSLQTKSAVTNVTASCCATIFLFFFFVHDMFLHEITWGWLYCFLTVIFTMSCRCDVMLFTGLLLCQCKNPCIVNIEFCQNRSAVFGCFV